MGRLEEKQWIQGAHAMRVRISPSWTAGRTCSKPAPIVPTRVRAPSPSLPGLFAVGRLASRWLQGKPPPPTASTPNPLTQESSGGAGEELQIPACTAPALPGLRKGAQHGRARDLAGSRRLQRGRLRGGTKGLWARKTAAGSHFRS